MTRPGRPAAWHAARCSNPYTTDVIDWVVGDLPGGSRIADIGCGAGQCSLAMARRGHEVIGLDPARSFVEEARRTGARAGVKARFEVGHAERAREIIGGSCAAVVFPKSVHWTNRPMSIAEARSLLGAQGRLVVLDSMITWSAWMRVAREISRPYVTPSPEFAPAPDADRRTTAELLAAMVGRVRCRRLRVRRQLTISQAVGLWLAMPDCAADTLGERVRQFAAALRHGLRPLGASDLYTIEDVTIMWAQTDATKTRSTR
ncbi:MAG: class I SAM-dependent methyltransferase [Acidobacteriota bacterium]